LASYPFGTPARPVPASGPPPAELTLSLEADRGLSEDDLVDKLRHLSEDEGLVVVIRKAEGRGAVSLSLHTTVDGAQRLLGAWRSKKLQVAVGVIVGALILTKGIDAALGATLAAATGQAGAAAGQVGAAAGQGGIVAGQVGAAAGQGGVVVSQVAAVGTGK